MQKAKTVHKLHFFSFSIISLKSFPLIFSGFNFFSLGTFPLENTTSGNELNNIYCIRYMQVIITFQLAKLTRYPQQQQVHTDIRAVTLLNIDQN